MLNTKPYFDKLARKEAHTEDEIVALLKAYATAQEGLAYMACCQAGTYEGLPASISKSRRARHAQLCQVAANLLDGDSSAVLHPIPLEYVRRRCQAATDHFNGNPK